MKREKIRYIICGVLLILIIMDYRAGIVCLGEPFILPAIACMTADEYCSAIDVPCRYMGSKPLDKEQAGGIGGGEPQAFVIDSQEEFEALHAAYGIDGTYAEGFDYTENILALSVNYRIDRICALEEAAIWQGDILYILPAVFYQNKMEPDTIYYYEVRRMDVEYEKDDKIYTTKLHLENPTNSEIKKAHINHFPFFNKWGWAFDNVNYGR